MHSNQILNIASWTHPLTWVIQVMPVFFLVGGYANALSWRSAQRRGEGYAAWLRSRLRRLGTPVIPLLLVWLAIASIAYAAGVPGGTLRTASQVALVPTWFLAAYVMVVALAPPALKLWERLGWWAVAGLLAEKDYREQLERYAVAVEKLVGTRPRLLLCFLQVRQQIWLKCFVSSNAVQEIDSYDTIPQHINITDKW